MTERSDSVEPEEADETHEGTFATDKPAQAIHISGRNGRALLSIFVWADDTFQVVNETGGNRALVIDTHKPPEKAQGPRQAVLA